MNDLDLEATENSFHFALGSFYSTWSAAETFIDFGLGKFLNVTHGHANLLGACLEFSRKAALLRTLVANSSDPKKELIIKALNFIQNDANRNMFAHSIVRVEPGQVIFIERSRYGKFTSKKHSFTLKQFLDHVKLCTDAAGNLSLGLGSTDDVLEPFLKAAENHQ